MNRRNLLPCVGMLLAVVSQEGMAAKPAYGSANYQSTDVCSVLSNPKLFLHKEISLRGPVFVGVDGANIRDVHCQDEGIDLSVESARYEQVDIVAFFQKVRAFGGHGTATVIGEFVATASPLTTYSLSIHKVLNITRTVK